MQFDGAVVKEQGVIFGIYVVQGHVLNNSAEAANARRLFMRALGAMPVVLMAQDSRGVPTYNGRRDIVEFLANIEMSRIPWKTYTVN
ncbi:MAG TPA: hypothetical protein VOA80_24775 [Thermoanaerobaculia bacterium]|nr:hypothetical protein [Thermoanaerobaculia bacterium]